MMNSQTTEISLESTTEAPVSSEPGGVPVGEQIRDLRKAKNMTITGLADLIGRSVGYISQVERNISPVPIDRLKEFAEALGVQITWFFQGGTTGPEAERDYIVRRSDRRKLTFTDSGVTEELLSPNLSGDFEMIRTTYAPRAKTGNANYIRPCEEAAHVIEGRLEIWIGERHCMLDSGDSITFDGREPHSSANPDDSPATVMWVMSPPTY
jgi:transcriptional regulator with XRE-family HTH domain